jgi:hypothetical protein
MRLQTTSQRIRRTLYVGVYFLMFSYEVPQTQLLLPELPPLLLPL